METVNELKVVKEFNLPAEAVYQAWTDPEQLKAWWKPMNAQLAEVKNELTEGGAIEYKFNGADHNNFIITGKYQEVRPNEKLVYTWNWHLLHEGENASDFKLSLTFKSNGQGSSMEVVQENFKNEEKVKPHQDGWERALEDLSKYLESKSNPRPAGTIDDHIQTLDYGS